jgi:hypothetical protein
MTLAEINGKPSASYRRTVDRIVDYLEGLPEEARSMWIDAAYRIHVESLVDTTDREQTASSAHPRRAQS